METLNNLLQTFKNILKQAQDEFKKALPTLFNPIFEVSDQIKAIGWTQGTPSFNDGEPCEFGVYDLHFYDENGTDGDSYCSYIQEDNILSFGYGDKEVSIKVTDEQKESINKAINTFCSIPNDIFLSAFGNGAEVIVWRDGEVVVDDYELGY